MIDAFASYAAFQFELSARQPDGSTLREHLEAVAERTGSLPATLANGPQLADGSRQLWIDFLELHGARRYNMGGPERITFRGMADWQDFRGVKLAGWQITAIQRADEAYFASLPKAKRQ